eukprot:1161696-Pelagomonas_calceolata.AAC.47
MEASMCLKHERSLMLLTSPLPNLGPYWLIVLCAPVRQHPSTPLNPTVSAERSCGKMEGM